MKIQNLWKLNLRRDIQKIWDEAKESLDTYINEPIKGHQVKGMISSELIPENITKGFIRYKHNLSVFKMGQLVLIWWNFYDSF